MVQAIVNAEYRRKWRPRLPNFDGCKRGCKEVLPGASKGAHNVIPGIKSVDL
jgi:hypothetical protein